ncbi:porphobilinogen synthase [Methanosphaerula palustris]|uniref:Delta-aminolevulinic acid dehydratase n=1 Tax=Methanosphaerula palustris (strain ATCC BAA-1556 / DSM 19958 / E1-9c) TaxID=521011 RepID=B8GJJ3_METPE|nr:porphobilinogen synthase [Methanosphaerula palustris]ACL17034.1 Porphobilinogen synthase [Methanosphaerula palustris E1-9c]
MRRLRGRHLLPLLTEHHLNKKDLIAPIFVDQTITVPRPIETMPGQNRYPVSAVGEVATRLFRKGIWALLLFGVPEVKDPEASGAFDPNGVIQQAVRAVKQAVPAMVVLTDVCACEYTSSGICGIGGPNRCGEVDLLNDPSLALMADIAVSHAEAGADIVAPSCMLDGMVITIRHALDQAGFQDVLILSYSTKFASALYGPFRDAADSSCFCGDRTSYQINPANGREGYMESRLDVDEGADMLMVKPAGFYLDVLASITDFGLPVAAYQVSGEYALIMAAAENGWINKKAVAMESLIAIKRAGADLIITYFAEDVAGWLDEDCE